MVTEVQHRRHALPGNITIAPQQVDVTICWIQTPLVHWSSDIWWFLDDPEFRRIRFRAVIVRHKKLETARVRVDLVYPLDPLPRNLTDHDVSRLHRTLILAIQAALPDWSVCKWDRCKIDAEFKGE